MVIRKGELVGIVGRVGAGKVCPQLYLPYSFSIGTVEPSFGNYWRYASERGQGNRMRHRFLCTAEPLVGHI